MKIKEKVIKNMTFCEKISKILVINKLKISSIKGLEDYLEIGRSTIGAHCAEKAQKINPRSEPGLKTQKVIIEKLRINQEWWDTGIGEIFIENENKTEKIEATAPNSELNTGEATLHKYIDDLRKGWSNSEKQIEMMERIEVMERVDSKQDRMLDEYREELEKLREKLTKVQPAQ
jgi:hypothetical protein